VRWRHRRLPAALIRRPAAILSVRAEIVADAADEHVPVEFERYVAARRRVGAIPVFPVGRIIRPGELIDPIVVPVADVNRLAIVAARHSSGLPRAGRTNEAVWQSGDNELVVGIGAVQVQTTDGVIAVTIPVRCDQTGQTDVHVSFAVGSAEQPTGLYAATQRRPQGPDVVIETWGEALVAYAWQVVLQLATGLAGATGRDAQGNRLVAAQLQATSDGLNIQPMARHRFAGTISMVSVLRT
jgi:hypothetical protein